MTSNNTKLFVLTLAIFALCTVPGRRGTAAESTSAANVQTETIVAATQAFLNSLSAERRDKVQLPLHATKDGDGRQVRQERHERRTRRRYAAWRSQWSRPSWSRPWR